jgi:hypothetical protein
MKVELKQIIDQLSDALDLAEDQKVAALVEDEEIVGWTIVNVFENGVITPVNNKKFTDIKDMFKSILSHDGESETW